MHIIHALLCRTTLTRQPSWHPYLPTQSLLPASVWQNPTIPTSNSSQMCLPVLMSTSITLATGAVILHSTFLKIKPAKMLLSDQQVPWSGRRGWHWSRHVDISVLHRDGIETFWFCLFTFNLALRWCLSATTARMTCSRPRLGTWISTPRTVNRPGGSPLGRGG